MNAFLYPSLAICISTLIIFIFWRFFYFWSDPERTVPAGKSIVSEADGTVVYIKRIKAGEVPISIKKKRTIILDELTQSPLHLSGDQYLVGVFMHPTSAHVNRAPIEGDVLEVQPMKGYGNLPMTAMWWRVLLRRKPFEKYSMHVLQNARNIIQIKGDFLITVIQIADIYVNKIISYVSKGDSVAKGQRIGAILLGSQVDVIFPVSSSVVIKVAVGEKVRAGATVIAQY